MLKSQSCLSVLLAAALLWVSQVSVADSGQRDSLKQRDVMVVVNRPNNLHVIDLAQEQVIRTCQFPGDSAPGTVVMSPDNHIAYVLAGRFGSIWGTFRIARSPFRQICPTTMCG